MFDWTSKEQLDKMRNWRKKSDGFLYKRDTMVRMMSKGKILELGCGEFPLFKDSVKVDISGVNGCIVANCNYPLPIKENFDTIIALELVSHLWDIDTFLKECHRLLKPDGKMIISSPNVKYWRNRIWLLFGNDTYFRSIGYYYNCFSPESLEKTLGEHGFNLIEKIPLGKSKILDLCGDFLVICKLSTEPKIRGLWV